MKRNKEDMLFLAFIGIVILAVTLLGVVINITSIDMIMNEPDGWINLILLVPFDAMFFLLFKMYLPAFLKLDVDKLPRWPY